MNLYIDSNNVYLFNDKYTAMVYKSHKDKIDCKKIVKLIGKNRVNIFINSFFATTEHKTFAAGLNQKDVKKLIEEYNAKPEVLFVCYNHLFQQGKGAEHKYDVILTIIKDHEDEKHIKKIINTLLETDIDLSKIYSFDRAVSAIGAQYLNSKHAIDINVVMLKDSALIIATNTNKYMFSRLIKKHNDEDLMTTTLKMLAMTLKYISTSYAFLQNEIKIMFLSPMSIDITAVKDSEPMLKTTTINSKLLTIPVLKLETETQEISSELQLLKLTMPTLKCVDNLLNKNILIHIKLHKLIKFLKIATIVSVVLAMLHGTWRYVSGTRLSSDDIAINKQYDDVIQNEQRAEKKLTALDDKIYAIVASEFSKNIADNSHLEGIKTIANVLHNYNNILRIEEYKFNCENCTNMDLRKNVLNVKFALFNVNASAKYAINKLTEIEDDIRNQLKTKYSKVEVSLSQLSREKRHAATNDVRDTIIITFQK